MLPARTPRPSLVLGIAATIAVVVSTATPAFAATAGVSPNVVQQTLVPGGHIDITKTVSTPPIVPKPDIYFLADTTGSMAPVIDNVKANAAAVLTAIDAAANDPRYGAGDYKDFQRPQQDDPYTFRNGASIPAGDDNGVAAKAAINAWSASGGGDIPEANLYALHRVLSAAGFRAAATKIVVWFGDAPGHDPVCKQLTGETAGVTEASVTAELVAAGVKVIAVSTTTGTPGGLNADPAAGATDYLPCGTPGGTPGQANRIAAATGGTVFANVPPADVATKILSGLTNLPVTVTAVPTCDVGLSATFDHTSVTVPSGTDAVFHETLTLADDVTAGDKVCSVDFRLNGNPAGPTFVEKNTISHNRPPICNNVTAGPSLWPPNHKFKTVTLSGATDPDGDAVTLVVTGVTQDEALNGLGDGDTAPDAALVPGHSNQVALRAERSGTGDGRVYRIAFTVSDGTAHCTGTVNVGVPHDQSGDAAVDTTSVVVNSFGS